MNQIELYQNEEMQAVLSQTSQFLSLNNLKVKKISPSITGLPLEKYSTANLRLHKNIHLSITLELEHLQQSESESVQSNLVASNVVQDYSFSELPVQQINLISTLEKYLQEKINENLQQAMLQSKAQFPNLEEQFQQFYSVLKANLIADFQKNLIIDTQFSNLIEASFCNISKVGKMPLKSQMTATQIIEDHSRLQQSYFQLKINELLAENRSKLVKELEDDKQQTDHSHVDNDKVAFSRLLVHYDIMKSRILADVERVVYQSMVEHQSKIVQINVLQQEAVIRGFLDRLPIINIEETIKDEEKEQPFNSSINLQRNKINLNGSVFLNQELKAYLSQMLHQNMQNSILK